MAAGLAIPIGQGFFVLHVDLHHHLATTPQGAQMALPHLAAVGAVVQADHHHQGLALGQGLRQGLGQIGRAGQNHAVLAVRWEGAAQGPPKQAHTHESREPMAPVRPALKAR